MTILDDKTITSKLSKLVNIEELLNSDDKSLIDEQVTLRCDLSIHFLELSTRSYSNVDFENLENSYKILEINDNISSNKFQILGSQFEEELTQLTLKYFKMNNNIKEYNRLEETSTRESRNSLLGRNRSFLENEEIENKESLIVDIDIINKSTDLNFVEWQYNLYSDLCNHYMTIMDENGNMDKLISYTQKVTKALKRLGFLKFGKHF